MFHRVPLPGSGASRRMSKSVAVEKEVHAQSVRTKISPRIIAHVHRLRCVKHYDTPATHDPEGTVRRDYDRCRLVDADADMRRMLEHHTDQSIRPFRLMKC